MSQNPSSPFFSKDLDPRLTPARDDLAAVWLKDHVTAPRYVEPSRFRICVPVAALYRSPDHNQSIETQLLYGEAVDVMEHNANWAWVQSINDGYVGYIARSAITQIQVEQAATHRVSNIGSFIFPNASYKDTPQAHLSYGSLVTVTAEKDNLSKLNTGGFIPSVHLSPIDFHSEEPVAEAFRFLGVPYLWGGRSHVGLDCSALIQLILQACNFKAPRDSDLQEKHLGRPIDRDDVQGGDLVFFRGHVGMMVDESTLIHANDRSMAVSIDDLDEYVRWRSKQGKTPVKMFKRL
jgi:cell wall-associated NlpC family hydrolase